MRAKYRMAYEDAGVPGHFDSTIWNNFPFALTISLSLPRQVGTTWVQQIVAQLLFKGAADLEVAEMSPWLDLAVPPKDVKLAAVAAHASSLP